MDGPISRAISVDLGRDVFWERRRLAGWGLLLVQRREMISEIVEEVQMGQSAILQPLQGQTDSTCIGFDV